MKKYLRFYGTAALLALLTILSIAGAAQAAYPSRVAQPPNPPGKVAPPRSPETHGRLSQLNWQTVSGNTVTFHATAGIRRSFYNPPPMSAIASPSPLSPLATAAILPTRILVTFVDTTHDWVIAEKTDTHTYSSPGPWTANFNNCCR